MKTTNFTLSVIAVGLMAGALCTQVSAFTFDQDPGDDALVWLEDFDNNNNGWVPLKPPSGRYFYMVYVDRVVSASPDVCIFLDRVIFVFFAMSILMHMYRVCARSFFL